MRGDPHALRSVVADSVVAGQIRPTIRAHPSVSNIGMWENEP
jgi:hypothetical protein